MMDITTAATQMIDFIAGLPESEMELNRTPKLKLSEKAFDVNLG